MYLNNMLIDLILCWLNVLNDTSHINNYSYKLNAKTQLGVFPLQYNIPLYNAIKGWLQREKKHRNARTETRKNAW